MNATNRAKEIVRAMAEKKEAGRCIPTLNKVALLQYVGERINTHCQSINLG